MFTSCIPLEDRRLNYRHDLLFKKMLLELLNKSTFMITLGEIFINHDQIPYCADWSLVIFFFSANARQLYSPNGDLWIGES